MFGVTDWVQKKLFLLLIKNAFGVYLRDDLDYNQIAVQLSSGYIILDALYLDTGYLNSQKVSHSFFQKTFI